MCMGERAGVALAVISVCLGGTAAAVTRYLVGNADPITLAILRWGIGFLCVLPTALLLRVRWPPRSDWLAVAGLGICFFGVFFILYNIAMSYTTAARASLALSTLPLQTMVVGALLGIEPLTPRNPSASASRSRRLRGAGVRSCRRARRCVARGAHHDRRRPVHGVLQRLVAAFIRRSSALGFLSVGMGAGAAALILAGYLTGGVAVLGSFGAPQWIAGAYLGVGGGALAFILWVMALERATPTRVANTMTLNPIAAGLLATQLVGEPITPNLVIGLVAVFSGIWIATTEARTA